MDLNFLRNLSITSKNEKEAKEEQEYLRKKEEIRNLLMKRAQAFVSEGWIEKAATEAAKEGKRMVNLRIIHMSQFIGYKMNHRWATGSGNYNRNNLPENERYIYDECIRKGFKTKLRYIGKEGGKVIEYAIQIHW